MKKQLELTSEMASEMLGLNPAFDTLIKANFTEKELSLQIDSWEAACRVHKIDPVKSLPDLSCLPADFREPIEARIQLELIAAAFRKNRVPNLVTDDLFVPWFDVEEDDSDPSGFRFSYDAWTDSDTYTGVGARLAVFTSEDAEYFSKQFLHLFKKTKLVFKKSN
nr:hypothetical protein [Pedobacter sp. ASV19]